MSTDKQSVENQRYEIEHFCKKIQVQVDNWIEETTSGSKDVDKRKLGLLLDSMQNGDIMICTELSRLGRNLLMIMGVLNQCMKNGIQVWTIKDEYKLGSDISSKVLAFAFGLSAEIERNLISQRTKEALKRKKDEGIVLGRPKGSFSKNTKLSGHKCEIKRMLERGVSMSEIARHFEVHRMTVSSFVKQHDLKHETLEKKTQTVQIAIR